METTTFAEETAARNWHALPAEQALRDLEVSRDGLSARDAAKRLSRFGPNLLPGAKRKSVFLRFLSQFNDFMIWVLLAAVVISGVFLKEYLDAGVIMIIVILNAVLGFVQESRAERAMEELKKLSAPTAKVIRDGVEQTIAARSLVPGDVIILEAGDVISADARLLEAANLRTNESSLTGESTAVEKDAAVLVEEDAVVGDRMNMVFAGTHIEYGRGTAVIAETGARTQMGLIAKMLEEGKPGPTPLQRELRDVGRRIVYICLATVVMVFAMGMIRGNTFAGMLLFAVSLAVAAIPEGLPAIVTITLAMGTQAMARENAIIRNLPAVETLGSANYICSDKTGTLTLNRMTVTDVIMADGKHHLIEDFIDNADEIHADAFRMMLEVAALCNDARPGAEGYIGDSTEVALLQAASRGGFEKEGLEDGMPRVAEIPFDSERKMMTTVHREDGRLVALVKGAAEEVLAKCDLVVMPDGERAITDADRSMVLGEVTELASQALRTIAVASRRMEALPSPLGPASLETGLSFLGAFAMKDPPRPEALGALQTCAKAHIGVSMITGDHRATAAAVGRELGMLVPGRRIIEGRELEKMSVEALARQVEEISIYARVSPHHKVKIVEALQSRGHVVAMTGDGVNDAPALRRADIGVAMGIAGTDVSKEAGDMVLADDNFATIVSAVRQGRIIFSNLKKFIYFLLSCNISEVLTMFLAMLFGFPLPLVPVQILWINLVTDGLPALALGVEPPEKDVMEQAPRMKGENILALKKQGWLLWQGLLITAGALGSFLLARYLLGYSWGSDATVDMSRTVLFTTMVLAQVFHSYNMRSEKRSFLSAAPWENRYLLGSFGISVALQLAVLYIPFMQKAFHTHAPSASAWAVILACALVPILIIDRLKVFLAKRAGSGSGRAA